MIRIFVGYDPRETVAFHVLCHSIHSRASKPVIICPLMLAQLGNVMWREKNTYQSTDFSFSRFLTPYLSGYEGWSIFMDCDMLVLDDISKLWDLRDNKYSVLCVKHDHKPKEERKFLNQPQTKYEKKNWSSVLLFNNSKCKSLTLDYVNSQSGLNLHRFEWLKSEKQIGELPKRWNHLVDYDPKVPVKDISNLHFTTGGPYYNEFKNCGYADIWWRERERMLYAADSPI